LFNGCHNYSRANIVTESEMSIYKTQHVVNYSTAQRDHLIPILISVNKSKGEVLYKNYESI